MIVFDLLCGGGHRFEAWFGSSEDYTDQKARHLLSCPSCGDQAIEKALMAPNVGPKANQAPAIVEKLRSHVMDNFDYVGADFAGEARKIHYGEADERPIWGEASPVERQELADEGIETFTLPGRPKTDA